jgi:C-3',4' desaturase CrtD
VDVPVPLSSQTQPVPLSSQTQRVAVIGGGIGGLTAAALLAHQGYTVKVYEQAWIPGGCASTFKRRGFTFDVGATQVAGLEAGGIHHRIFELLEVDGPAATPCDPTCAVFLPGETTPIQVWRDPERWRQERQRQFPGSEPFWQLLKRLFNASWAFQLRDPVIPPRSLGDLWQTARALRPDTLITLPHLFSTVGDALRGYGLEGDRRLKTFLDLQLKLYSQVDSDRTALLYAATALSVSQAPQGLSHLHGSMQVLSDHLVAALKRDGGSLHLGHRVTQIHSEADRNRADRMTGVSVTDLKTGDIRFDAADCVVANVPVQNLVALLGDRVPVGYKQRAANLPPASGAFVVYLGVKAEAIPPDCPPHLQFLFDYDGPIGENNSLFVSVSQPGDGRAPAGQATIIASSFTDLEQWQQPETYAQLKESYTEHAIARLGEYFTLNPDTLVHQEAATPKTFEHFTARSLGQVGGIGQRVSTFGPFGFATRTPLPNLWLVGDSTHPGEGTAGVSYSALTIVQQILASAGSNHLQRP